MLVILCCESLHFSFDGTLTSHLSVGLCLSLAVLELVVLYFRQRLFKQKENVSNESPLMKIAACTAF